MFIGKSKNFSYCYEGVRSPEFRFSGEAYRLLLNLNLFHVECGLKALVNKRYSSDFKIEISFLTCDGSPEESVSGSKNINLKPLKDVIFGNRRNAFLPGNILTVRCRCLTKSERGKLFICSQIGVKRKYFLWTFKYDNYQARGWLDADDDEYDNDYADYSAEKSTLYGDIQLKLKCVGEINSEEQFSVEISRTGGERCFCFLKISVLGVDGKALNEVSDDFVLEKRDGPQTRGFPSIIKKSKWIRYKNLLLSDDKLSLKCYLTLSRGKVAVADISYCDSATHLLKESEDLSMSFKDNNEFRSVTKLQTDLKDILDKGTLFDASLHVGSEVIRVHKSILSARSPVFSAMFSKNMIEAIDNTVVIEDFDVETVRRLLLYMYTDSIADDQWEDMKKLYSAAEKYGVLSLKAECVSFLKTSLSISNVCEALLLADLHQDADLKTAAIEFITEYDSAVLASDAWKELESNNPSSVIQVLKEICCNKQFK